MAYFVASHIVKVLCTAKYAQSLLMTAGSKTLSEHAVYKILNAVSKTYNRKDINGCLNNVHIDCFTQKLLSLMDLCETWIIY